MKAYPFLHKHPTTGETTLSHGMDLRDYFAGLAMQAITWKRNGMPMVEAKKAYSIADAMMKQREIKDE